MSDHQNHNVYDSTVAFDASRIGAAAIYCSDGRFGEQCDDLLHQGLGLPRYDRLAVPGGPACLAGHFATYHEGDALHAQLEFLIDTHGLQRIVLIAHQDCAYYTARLEVSPLGLAEQQLEDLAKATQRVREIRGGLAVQAFFAHRHGQTVSFEQVELV